MKKGSKKSNKIIWWIAGIAVIIVALVIGIERANNGENNAGIANPASVYCEEQGGNVEIKTDSSGGQAGICVFDDGSSCDEWAFFRGECNKGSVNYCFSDSDCVKDSCCHAKACVTQQNAPVCEKVMCTMNCEPGTLDCGGSCICENNQCKAQIAG